MQAQTLLPIEPGKNKELKMTIEKAIEILELTKLQSPAYYKMIATLKLKTMTSRMPLRYKVACMVLINA